MCKAPTHNKGFTLDAISTKNDLASLKAILPINWSDHHLISFHLNSLPLQQSTLSYKSYHWTRNLRHIPESELESMIVNQLQPQPELLSTKELTSHYNAKMTTLLDHVTPIRLKRSRPIPSKS